MGRGVRGRITLQVPGSQTSLVGIQAKSPETWSDPRVRVNKLRCRGFTPAGHRAVWSCLLWATDYAPFFHHIHQAGGTPVSDAQAALQERDGSLLQPPHLSTAGW